MDQIHQRAVAVRGDVSRRRVVFCTVCSVVRAGTAGRFPYEAVVDGQDDRGQRHGQNIGEHGGQSYPLLIGLCSHLRLLVAGVGGRFAPLHVGHVVSVPIDSVFSSMLHDPVRLEGCW